MSEDIKDQIPKRAKILLIKLRSIGDVVYNTAVYAPLKRCFPESHLTVLVEPASYDLVKSHPDVDEALCFEKGSRGRVIAFYWNLFARRFDVAIDMHEGTRGAVMCLITGAKFRVGNKYAKRAFFYNTRIDFSDLKPKYPIDYQVALIKKLGAVFEKVAPDIRLSSESTENARRLLNDKGIQTGDNYCIIHPGTRKLYDQWQFDKFARLAEIFHSRYGLKVILTCGPGEEEQVLSVLSHIQDTPVAFLQTGLQELAAISQNARFALCHNGGYMHLAAAMKTPVVALFGVVHPRVWKPMGEKHVILYKNLECSPCNHKTRFPECYRGDAECKRAILVEDVLSAVENILSGKSRAPR